MTFINYDLNAIVKPGHALRAVDGIISFKRLAEGFSGLEKETGRKGYGVEIGLRGLFLQFFYDLSDREMEERLRYDIAFKWFCKMTVDEETPDHTYFCRIRRALGAERISKIFKSINERAAKKGILRQVFTFVDASAVKSKEATWTERDKTLSDGVCELKAAKLQTESRDFCPKNYSGASLMPG